MMPLAAMPSVRERTAADRARRRILDEMAAQHVTQRDMAGLTGWSQSKVAKILTGRVQLLVDDLAGLAWALNLTLVECVRDPSYEFVADLAPTEVRALAKFRELRPEEYAAFLTLLGIGAPADAKRHRR